MSEHPWVKNFPASITVCDTQGLILEINDAAAEVFRADGGEKLIGENLFNCHSERSCQILEGLMANQQTNVYTIEKKWPQEADLSNALVQRWSVRRFCRAFSGHPCGDAAFHPRLISNRASLVLLVYNK